MLAEPEDCLTEAEYDEKLHGLYSRYAVSGGSIFKMEQSIKEAEFNLLIDFKLGKSFAQNRRAELWKVMQNLHNRVKGGIFRFFFSRLFPKSYGCWLQKNIDEVMKDFKKILSEDELKKLFDLTSADERLILPIGINNIQ